MKVVTHDVEDADEFLWGIASIFHNISIFNPSINGKAKEVIYQLLSKRLLIIDEARYYVCPRCLQ